MKNIIFFILFIIYSSKSFSEKMILDQLQNPNLTTQDQEWNFITDQVMGGVSSGLFKVEKFDNMKCYRMKGNVSTKNNGGFIQIRAKLKPNIDTNDYKGIYIKVYGNEKDYSIHLRTGLTFAPWQYYSYKFYSPKNWIEIRAPFTKFKKSNFYQPNNIFGQKIKSIGLVAGFSNFKSDICLGEVGFF